MPLAVDSVNLIFVIAFVLVGVLGMIYTLGTRPPVNRPLLALAFILASLACVTSVNMLYMLIFWELMLVTSYLMIVSAGTAESSRAGYRYLMYHVLCGAGMFLGVLTQYQHTGTFAFSAPVAAAIPFFALGIGIKVGALPFHTWVPDAYSRALPSASVVLSGFTTKVGVYAIIRLLPGVTWVPYVGAAMALSGAAMALLQRSSRRMLGYSIVSQAGYVLAGVGLATAAGVDGGSLHLVSNIAYKTLLFMAAGAVIHSVGTGYLPKLGDLARYMPVTFGCTLIGALSIAGVPPFNGFVSKHFLKIALDAHPVIMHSLTIAGVGTGAYVTKLLWYTYLRPAENHDTDGHPEEVGLGMLIPMVGLAVFCLYTGINSGAISAYLPHGGPAPDPYSLSGLLGGSWPPLLGVLVFALAGGVIGRIPEPPDLDVVYAKIIAGIQWTGAQLAGLTEDRLQGNLTALLIVLIGLIVMFA